QPERHVLALLGLAAEADRRPAPRGGGPDDDPAPGTLVAAQLELLLLDGEAEPAVGPCFGPLLEVDDPSRQSADVNSGAREGFAAGVEDATAVGEGVRNVRLGLVGDGRSLPLRRRERSLFWFRLVRPGAGPDASGPDGEKAEQQYRRGQQPDFSC